MAVAAVAFVLVSAAASALSGLASGAPPGFAIEVDEEHENLQAGKRREDEVERLRRQAEEKFLQMDLEENLSKNQVQEKDSTVRLRFRFNWRKRR